MQTIFKIASLFIALSFSSGVYAAQADIDAELAEYKRIFESDNFQQQRRVMDKLIWAGYGATEFYDLMAEKLTSLKGSKDKPSKEKAAWYAKTLALSGDEKYRPVLTAVSNSAKAKKVRKNAELGLERLATYRRWNPVITQGLADAPTGRLEEARVKNMLASRDYGLLRIGAKRVYHGHKNDADLVELAKQRLAQEWPTADGGNDEQIDAIAWLIKVMAESGLKSNKTLLDQIASESRSSKVKKYAKKYAAYLN